MRRSRRARVPLRGTSLGATRYRTNASSTRIPRPAVTDLSSCVQSKHKPVERHTKVPKSGIHASPVAPSSRRIPAFKLLSHPTPNAESSNRSSLRAGARRARSAEIPTYYAARMQAPVMGNGFRKKQNPRGDIRMQDTLAGRSGSTPPGEK